MKYAAETIRISNWLLPVIRHPRRKHMAIVVADGKATVRVPLRYSKRLLQRFVTANHQWLIDTLSRHPPQVKVVFANQMQLALAGSLLRLDLQQATQEELLLRGSTLLWRYTQRPAAAEIRQKLTAWYLSQARQTILPRVQHIASQMKIVMPTVSFGSARTRWGSCAANGSLRFTWHLVKAPLEHIDAVIVHELCHVLEFNHSQRFWDLVTKYDPDYVQSRRWFAEHAAELTAW